MKHTDFRIAMEFTCGVNRWRCTDVGTRTVVAILIQPNKDPSWYTGPPYEVDEVVFDEVDFPACSLAKGRI